MKISVVTPSIRPEGLTSVRESLMTQTFQDFEWHVDIGIGKHDLNAAFNRMLKRSRGELIVFCEDWNKMPPNYLQKFWDAYQKHPDTLFTAPVGKVDDLGKPEGMRWDWRAYEDAKPTSEMWEIDSGCAPLKALQEVGGFDEELDKRWSSDNVSVGIRAEMAGYKFANLFNNPVIVYDHDKFSLHPFRERFDPEFTAERFAQYRQGLKIDYLA